MNRVLHEAMTEAGETAESLAARVGVDPKTATRWLNPGRIPQPRRRAQVASILGRDVLDIWPDVLKRKEHVWFRQWADYEREAVALRTFEMSVMPGLLQTPDYARAVFECGGLLNAGGVADQLAVRLDRQAVLSKAEPPMFTAVLDESVLRRPVGGASTMREQLLHLVRMSDNPRIKLHVVPMRTGAYLGIAGAFVLATLPTEQVAAYLDDQLEGKVIDRADRLVTLQRVWESILSEALPHQHSVEVIKEVAQTWT